MTDFLSEDGYVPPKVRKNLLGIIIEDLLVVNSISLAHTWLTFNHDITERFMATPHGLYISFPGVSLPNAFDATEYGCFVIDDSLRSSSPAFCEVTDWNQHHGTVLIPPLDGRWVSLDVLKEDVTVFPSAERHITLVYPWLAIRLQQSNILKTSWCTALSKGRHTLTYLLHISNGSYVTHDVTERDACRMFVLKHINGSNLLALVLADRRWQGCSEWSPSRRE
ncbi:hypothetical protein C0Q70_15584 [Pomacea canaliculata]|uniref:Uncharacterized protein n=1 Tax=Pomacea canaliculata TaxID=400727 RepID=A0A2T7NVB2_POMCA|nr:hypothetical protein C0Q70_15584 [Pomacea canaliculata]